MRESHSLLVPRRGMLRLAGALGAGVAASGALAPRHRVFAQDVMLSASGAGVNVKQMPAPDGNGTVPLRESFSFDAHYAQCIIEDNPSAFAMPTFSMGTVTIEEHQFFMGMYANDVAVVSIKRNASGLLVAKLTGSLGCATYAGTADTVVGSRTATEPAFYEIEAIDGGEGGGAAGDSFTFTVYFDATQSPLNYAIFGPNPAFTGTMVSGEVTIAPPVLLPVTS